MEGKFECQICWFCDEPKNLVKFPCYHIICPKCVEKQIFRAKDKKMIIKCPWENCKSSMDFEALKENLTLRTLQIVIKRNPELSPERKSDLKEEWEISPDANGIIYMTTKTEPIYNSRKDGEDLILCKNNSELPPEIKIESQKTNLSLENENFEKKREEKINLMKQSWSHYGSGLHEIVEKGCQQTIKQSGFFDIDHNCSRNGICFHQKCSIF